MKKITLIIAVIALVLASCQNKEAYTIQGSFEEEIFDGKLVYLQTIDSMTAQTSTVIDSVVVKDQKFKLKGVAKTEKSLAFLSVGKLGLLETNSPVGTIVLEPGTINITFAANGDVAISGTQGNDDYNNILKVMNSIAALYKEVSDAGGVQAVPVDSAGNDAQARLTKLQGSMKDATLSFAKQNMTNKAGQFVFFTSANSFSREELGELVEASDSAFKQTPEIKALIEDLNRVYPDVGLPYADVDMVDTQGNRVKLSSFVGGNKYVLIDFWASWCAPCIKEMPALKALYAKYKGKGLEIVGVSEDEDRVAWLDAVKKQGMNWVQLADDKQEGAMSYRVSTIPHTVLVNQEGVVVAKGLVGKELEDKISELLD